MTESTENLTLAMLREIRSELKELRHDVGNIRTLCLGSFDRLKRLERRLEETRDDLETTIKAEIMGTGMHWRRDLENRIEVLEDRHPHS